MRITRAQLDSRMVMINNVLGRPLETFNAVTGKQNIGHMLLNKDSAGYSLAEITNQFGGETTLIYACGAQPMYLQLSAMYMGICLAKVQ